MTRLYKTTRLEALQQALERLSADSEWCDDHLDALMVLSVWYAELAAREHQARTLMPGERYVAEREKR